MKNETTSTVGNILMHCIEDEEFFRFTFARIGTTEWHEFKLPKADFVDIMCALELVTRTARVLRKDEI